MYRLVKNRAHLGMSYFISAFVLFLLTSSLVQASTMRPTTTSTFTNPKAAYMMYWPAFNGGGSRNGINTLEGTLSQQNVGRLAQLWQSNLPAVVDSSPVALAHVATAGGFKDLLFIDTKSGSLLAINEANGQIVWRKDTQGVNITTSTPVIDPNWRYVYSYGIDGKVHKYAVGNGAEVVNGVWPTTATLMPNVEKGSSALNIGNGYLYVTTSGYNGDGGHYEGHIVAVNLVSGAKTVFNVLCSNVRTLLNNVPGSANYCPDIQAGVWGRGGAVIEPQGGYVYITSGNGAFGPGAKGFNYGDSIVKLSPNLASVVDSYTPTNYRAMQANDLDLGSDMPTMLPVQKGSRTPYMAVQGGKDNTLRLLNRNNMSSSARPGPGHVGGELQSIAVPQGGDIDTHMNAWQDANNQTWVFVANDSGFSAFKVVTDGAGRTTLRLAYTNGTTGSSPIIANGVLFMQSHGSTVAMAPTTGAILWSGNTGTLHWQSPIVVNGHLYVVDNAGNMYAFGLK